MEPESTHPCLGGCWPWWRGLLWLLQQILRAAPVKFMLGFDGATMMTVSDANADGVDGPAPLAPAASVQQYLAMDGA